MAFRNQIINPNPKTTLRHEMAQGAVVGDRALYKDGKVRHWSGERWEISGDQSEATNTTWLQQLSVKKMVEDISNVISELEHKLNQIPGVSLTDAEMEGFLQKAIEQVTPYYNKKRTEIEKGIAEGKIRDAEDLLSKIRDVETNTYSLLAKYDIEQVDTEEKLTDTLANITAKKAEDLEYHRMNWQERIREGKQTQVQTGILTSGIGKQRIEEMLEKAELEKGSIERTTGVQEQEAQRTAKYDLERVKLARETAQKQREAAIGKPEETAATAEKLRGTLREGYPLVGETYAEGLSSETELLARRALRNISVYRPEALTEMEEERKRATESRKQEFQEAELTIREQEEKRQRQLIESQIAAKQRQLMGAYSFY